MCGIAGYFDPSFRLKPENYSQMITEMTNQIIHRGPDDSGTWLDESRGIVLGFRRLAIVDLTPTGHQPMLSADGRFVMVFNGEVYNFEEIREELYGSGHTFRGTSDTEVMLEAISEWGIKKALSRFNGMFAFALWDRLEGHLILARDRVGIKPLYYGWMNGVFLFGSELKALRTHPAFETHINRDALSLYLRHNYIPAPFSIYEHISKLQPGTFLTINGNDVQKIHDAKPYWSMFETVQGGAHHPFEGSDSEAVDELESLLKGSIRQRMISDVPLGAFLSGGVDSSLIVALMQTQSSVPVKTFTIGFDEKNYNEAVFARAVAGHLKTDHTELYVSADDARAVIPKLPALYDEPFSDSSQIPTFLVAQLARQSVTVSLSGDGGDELFAGYERYQWMRKITGFTSLMNGSMAGAGSRLLNWSASDSFNGFWKILGSNRVGGGTQRTRDRMVKLSEVFKHQPDEQIYKELLSHWKNPDQVVRKGHEPQTILLDRSRWPAFRNFTETMMYLDMMTYLPDDILVKVDRASMGVSLEARAPLLDDHRVIEFAWRLPMAMKYRNGQSKWILRQVLYRHVPRKLIERPKMGFGVPIDSWLRGPLKNWADSLLEENRLTRQGYLNPIPIRQKWTDHLSGKNNWQYYLWDILMFQSWLSYNGLD
jgi:asparagine synthase (glutamine-hydrolysing)